MVERLVWVPFDLSLAVKVVLGEESLDLFCFHFMRDIVNMADKLGRGRVIDRLKTELRSCTCV